MSATISPTYVVNVAAHMALISLLAWACVAVCKEARARAAMAAGGLLVVSLLPWITAALVPEKERALANPVVAPVKLDVTPVVSEVAKPVRWTRACSTPVVPSAVWVFDLLLALLTVKPLALFVQVVPLFEASTE